MSELQIHILFKDERYYVLLRHSNGSEEISEQSFASRKECEKAIEQYAKDRRAKLVRKYVFSGEVRDD
jgi:hypothetical protein